MSSESSARAWRPVTLGAGIAPPAGAYSPAVIAGDLVFVSGQIPKDPRSGELIGTEVATQTKQVLENVRGALVAAGATLGDVVAVTVFLADEEDWDTFNEIYKGTMTPPYPTRTVVGASLRGGVLVEVNAIARVTR